MYNFSTFKQAVTAQFALMEKGMLLTTKVSKDELWDTYLGSFPEGSNPIFRERTEHDCSCCKQFIRTMGDVVYMSACSKRCTASTREAPPQEADPRNLTYEAGDPSSPPPAEQG